MYKIHTNEFRTMLYKEDESLWITMHEDNADYRKYLEWVAEGNEAEEWSAE
jgi:hypothetical protein